MANEMERLARLSWGDRIPAVRVPAGPRYSGSLVTALAILRFFTAERLLCGVADIADALALSRSTTHRYLVTFVELGVLEQDRSRKYRLGTGAADIGIAALEVHPLRRSVRGVLAELHERTALTASAGVLINSELMYLERVRGSGGGQREIDLGVLGLRTGYRLPAHCTAMGKVLLAALPEPERRGRIAKLKLTRMAPCSITSKRALREELARVAAAGFALSDRETAPMLLSAAVPVRDEAGAVLAAVAVEAHTAAATPEGLLRDAAPLLSAAAARLAESLPVPPESAGARTPPEAKPLNGTPTRVGPASGLPRARGNGR